MVERVGGHGIRSVFYSLLIMDLELQMFLFNIASVISEFNHLDCSVFHPCGLATIFFCKLIIMEHNINVSHDNGKCPMVEI